jgi:Ca2+/H+ antiporter, TMEM165/GDT1 family
VFPIFLTAFGAVFAAEIAGDKLLYTAAILATRYRASAVVLGIIAAFMVKMGVAVAVGRAIGNLHPAYVAAATILSIAWVVSRLLHTADAKRAGTSVDLPDTEAVAVSFTTVSFAEWGDLGQITAATIAAQLGHPLVVWTGAVLAMTVKAALAVLVSARLARPMRARLSPDAMRAASVTILVAVGLWTVFETLSKH